MSPSTLSPEKPVATAKKTRVLIVEDEAIVAEDIAQRLKRMSYEVVGPVNSGEDAILLAQQLRPDLVLMDIVLRGRMDGVETAEMIAHHYDLPVVFLTAHGDPATFARAKSTVPRGYVLKPFSESDLHRHIELAISQHREARVLDRARSRLSDTLRSITEGIIATDAAGTVTFLNPAAETLLGVPSTSMVGQALVDVLLLSHIDRKEAVPCSLDSALSTGRAVSNAVPVRVSSALGPESIVEESATPICNESGAIIGGLVVLRVLADRNSAHDERTQLITALRTSMSETSELRAVLPVCAWCKRIHATDGTWKTLEEILGRAQQVTMTHGICPTCSTKITESLQ